MDILAGIICAGVITVQSLVCIISSCRTNDRIDELKEKLDKICKNASIRIIRLENAQYYSKPGATATALPEPSPSAPGFYDSYPKTYVPPQVTPSVPTVYGSL